MRIAGTERPAQRQQRIRDDAYRRHVASQPCLVCGRLNTVQAAHIRHGMTGGMGYKPDDSLCTPLCSVSGCAAHMAFDTNQERKARELLKTDIETLKKRARERYESWKRKDSPDGPEQLDT